MVNVSVATLRELGAAAITKPVRGMGYRFTP